MFKNPFSFEGRIRRTEYGISFILAIIVLAILSSLAENNQILYILYIPLYWFIFAQGAKRCHDFDENGWWQIVPFYVLIMLFKNGDPTENKYGKDPKPLVGTPTPQDKKAE